MLRRLAGRRVRVPPPRLRAWGKSPDSRAESVSRGRQIPRESRLVAKMAIAAHASYRARGPPDPFGVTAPACGVGGVEGPPSRVRSRVNA